MKHSSFYCLVLGVLCSLAIAGPKVNVISPHQLASEFEKSSGIPFTLATYGKVPYGAHFIGGLAIADPVEGCDFIDHFNAGELQFDHNIIAVLRSGGCQNTVKTRNAQNAGAKMAIVVHDSDNLPSVVGAASVTESITIPTIIIPKTHGEKIIKFIEKLPFPPLNPEDIVPIISVNFPYDATSETVALDFWYSASDVDNTAYQFINDIAPYLMEEKAFKFTPHFVTWDCLICKRLNYEVPLTGDCISGGRYCAPDPDEEGPLTGTDILSEDLRQACMWKTNPLIWWSYTALYPNNCLRADESGSDKNSEECSNNQLNFVTDQINSGKVIQCVKDSFFKKANSNGPIDQSIDDNSILSEERKLQLQYDITEFPVLLINHKPYSESLTDIRSVLKEICLNVKNPPLICRDVGVGYKTSRGLNIVLTLLVILLVAAMIILFCYRKLTKKGLGIELSTEANNMVSRYMAMKDNVSLNKEEDDDNDLAK